MKVLGRPKVQVRAVLPAIAAVAALAGLYIFRLGSLTGGMTSGEVSVARQPLGWHGLYHQPFYLPLNLARSAIFYLRPDHGQTLTRLASVLFGLLTIIALFVAIRVWYGFRIAVMATLLFACSAWALHAGRLASYDVLYLWALPTLVLTHIGMRRYSDNTPYFLGVILIWGLLLYIPGLVWLVLPTIAVNYEYLLDGWTDMNKKGRTGSILLVLVLLPLLIYRLFKPSALITWLGAPRHFAAPLTLLKQLGAVPLHLLIRGPQYPDIWLGKSPVLDIFSLAMCVVGLYYFMSHIRNARSLLLLGYGAIGTLLVALGGPVGLSLLVPLLYVFIATGIAYMLREWRTRFPRNPLARGVGVTLICAAIALSCVYNLRAYFIAWPHNDVTKSTFRYHL